MSFFTLTLVRHGQTTANKEGILQGQSNTQLSDVGYCQAQLVANRLQNDYFSHIFSSDLDRAAQTAQAVKDGNKLSTCTIELDQRLRERHFGCWQGRPGKEFRETYKNDKEDWRPPGGGEKSQQVQQRAASFFSDLCQQMRQYKPRDDNPLTAGNTGTASTTASSSPFTSIQNDVPISTNTSSSKPGQSPDDDDDDDDVPSVDSAISEGPESPFLHDTDLKTIQTAAASSDSCCPNVSLSPLVEQRFTRFSSVSSGRNSFEDSDYLPSNVSDVLVVGHGGWIREMMRVFINEYNCRMSGGNRHALLISPNTGMSRFVVSLPEDNTSPRVTCVFLHDKSHLDSEYKTACDL